MTTARTSLKRISFFIGFVVLLAGCSYLVISQRPDRIVFSHKKHVDNGVGCDTCHSTIAESTNDQERHFPGMDTCGACHADQVQSKCTMCHTEPDRAAKAERTPTKLHFSHKDHLGRVNGDCQVCHKAVTRSTSTAHLKLPGLDQCRTCHSKDIAELRCSKCHVSLAEYAMEPTSLFSHQGNYLKEHKEYAQADVSLCAQCHDQSYCSDCHSKTEPLKPSIKFPERLDREFIHRGDWITVHRFEARTDSNQCLRCHDTRFCSECHQKEGVSMAAASAADPHPPGWATSHGDAARRDTLTCASCHDQGSSTICITCHRTGKIDPHPPGWKSTLDKNKEPVCRNCHS